MRIFGKVAISKSLLKALVVCIALRLTIINAAGLETLRAECFPHLGGKEGPWLSTSFSIHGILCSLSYRHFKFNFWRFPRSGSNRGLELVLWKGLLGCWGGLRCFDVSSVPANCASGFGFLTAAAWGGFAALPRQQGAWKRRDTAPCSPTQASLQHALC